MSPSALMRSRAAVLCLGGVGLQTMLHLWPRIRFVQEEREVVGLGDELPNLNELTAFAAVMPQPLVPDDPQAAQGFMPFEVLAPGVLPRPFYLEEQLKLIHSQLRAEGSGWGRCTYGELVATRLKRRALEDSHLRQLTVRPGKVVRYQPGHLMTREEAFGEALRWSETLAQALLREVINPTRRDRVQFRDPAVRTSIHVVASLAEPLVSCLIWPLVSELAAQMGETYVARITAFLITASFAADQSEAVEQASVYTAVQELQTLLGLRQKGREALVELMSSLHRDAREWPARVGRRVFDEIYILDREKISQSLAEDAQELAVLISNAVEAFLVADGALHIERHLGSHLDEHPATPFSVVGAANDYVPIADYVRAAIREEQKRIVRHAVLGETEGVRNGSLEGDVEQKKTYKDLAYLGASPERVVRRLVASQVGHMFDQIYDPAELPWSSDLLPSGALAPAWGDDPAMVDLCKETRRKLPALRLSSSYVLPPLLKRKLAQARSDWAWVVKFEARERELDRGFSRSIEDLLRKLEREWGVRSQSTLAPGEEGDILNVFSQTTWAERAEKAKDVISVALWRGLRETVRTVCSKPGGLLAAFHQVRAWADETETLVNCLRAGGLNEEEFQRWQETYEARRQAWALRFARVAGSRPHASAALLRALPVGILGVFALYNVILFNLGWRLVTWQFFALMLASAVAIWLLAMLPYAVNRGLVWLLRRERLRLAQDRLSIKANLEVWNSLHRIYRDLLLGLRALLQPLEHAITALRRDSVSGEPIRIPPDGIPRTHLRIAHTNEKVWREIRSLISGQETGQQACEDRFVRAWQRDGSDLKLWQEREPGHKLAQRVRLALEQGLNRAQRNMAVSQPAQRNPSPQQLECPFRGRTSAGCTACPDGELCLLKDDLWKHWSLDAVIWEYVGKATEPLEPKQQIIPGGPDTVREIIERFAFERVVFDGTSSDDWEHRQRSFVEDLYARAKVSANYELRQKIDYEPIQIEFGVTADNTKTVLHPQFAQRGMPVLSSYDPMAVSAVRTEHGLPLEDFAFYDRCKMSYLGLPTSERKRLELAGTVPGNGLY